MTIQHITAQSSAQPAANAVQTFIAAQNEAQQEALKSVTDGDESLGALGGKINTVA